MRGIIIFLRKYSLNKIAIFNLFATIWEALQRRDKKMAPLMWNAFPFHPHKEGNEESNRAPLAKEMKVGKLFIELLKRIFNIADENVYAIGRKAQEQLGFSKEKYIRHPSYGGKIECQEKIMSINIKKSPI